MLGVGVMDGKMLERRVGKLRLWGTVTHDKASGDGEV